MNNTEPQKSKSILGIISIVIATLIGICFVFFALFALLARDKDLLFIWVYPTFITAPAGMITGAIALFTKRAWLGLVLNSLFLLISIGSLVFVIIYGITHYAIWR